MFFPRQLRGPALKAGHYKSSKKESRTILSKCGRKEKCRDLKAGRSGKSLAGINFSCRVDPPESRRKREPDTKHCMCKNLVLNLCGMK